MANSENTIKLIAPTIGTHNEWLTKGDSFVLPNGVLGIVQNRLYNGQVEYVVGNGIDKYSDLPKSGVTIPDNGLLNNVLSIGSDKKLKWLTSIPASMLSGMISIDNIPKAAVSTLKIVNNKDERFALTVEDVQNGDTVKQLDGNNGKGALYYVKDDTKLNSEDGYEPYTASTDWISITSKPTTLSGYGITDAMTATEINNSLNGKQNVGDYVTSDTLTSYATVTALNEGLATKQNTGNYVTTSSMTTELAKKADITSLSAYATVTSLETGLSTKQDAGDYATTTALTNGLSGKANTTHNHTVSQIPDFPDLSIYATTTALTSGLSKKADISSLSVYALKTELTSGLADKADTIHAHTVSQITDFPSLSGYATITALNDGLAKKADITSLSAYATVTALNEGLATKQAAGDYVSATDLSDGLATKADVSSLSVYALKTELTSGLSGKANTTHNHTVSQITDFPDLSGYATKIELTNGLADKADASALSTYALKTDIPTSLPANGGNSATATKLANARTIGLSGVTATPASFDGSGNVTIAITEIPYSILTGTPLPEFKRTYIASPSAPADLTILWIDTAKSDPIMKYYDGTTWVAITMPNATIS